MEGRVLEYDPVTRTRTMFYWDEADNSFVIQPEYDPEPVVEANKAVASGFDERTPWKGDWHRVASIPLTLYNELQAKGILDDDKAFRRWLNDRDNMAFRTRPGRV